MKEKKSNNLLDFFTDNFSVVRILVALVISILIITGIIYFVSDQPFESIQSLLLGPLQSKRAFFSVIERGVPLMFSALAINIVLTSGIFNIGQDGALYMGAVVASVVAIKVDLPPYIHPLVAVLAGATVGALISMLPVILNLLTGVSPIVLAIMFNSIFYYFGFSIVSNFLLEKAGSWRSAPFAETAKFGKILPGTKMHYGFILLILSYLFVVVLFKRSKLGYQIRMVGKNQEFSKTSGIKTLKTVLTAQLIGGAIAGGGGAVEVLGSYQRFLWQSPVQFIWDGLLIHMLTNGNPVFLPLTTFFIAYLRVGSEVMSRATGIAPEIIYVLQGITIVLIASNKFLSGFRTRLRNKRLEGRLSEL